MKSKLVEILKEMIEQKRNGVDMLIFLKKEDEKLMTLDLLNSFSDEELQNEALIYAIFEATLDATDQTISLLDQYIELNEKVKENPLVAKKIIEFNGEHLYSLNSETYYQSLAYKHLPKKLLKDLNFIMEVWKNDPKSLLLEHIRDLFDKKALHVVENNRSYLNEILTASTENIDNEGSTLVLFKTDIENINEAELFQAIKDRNYAILKRPEIVQKFKNTKNKELIREISDLRHEDFFYGSHFENSLPDEYVLRDLDELLYTISAYESL